MTTQDTVAEFELRIVDEGDSLARFDTIEALLEDGVTSGQLEISARQSRPSDDFATLSTHPGGNAIPTWWSERTEVVSAGFKIFRLRDAVVLPGYGIVISQNGEIMKSSYAEAQYLLGDPQSLPADLTEKIRSACSRSDTTDIIEIDAAVVVMPWGANTNYGHFILDALPNMVVYNRTRALAGHTPVFPVLKTWHRDHLQLLECSDPLILADDVYLVRDIVWTSALDHFLQTPTDILRDLAETQIANLTGPDCPTGRKIWISRAGDDKRGFAQEDRLEMLLEDLGFDILHPEALSVDEQIAAFRSASLVAGFTGAGLSNIIYCKPGANVVEVLPELMQGIWLRNVAAVTGINWHPFFCEAFRPEGVVIVGGVERHDIGIRPNLDIDEFIRFMTNILN